MLRTAKTLASKFSQCPVHHLDDPTLTALHHLQSAIYHLKGIRHCLTRLATTRQITSLEQFTHQEIGYLGLAGTKARHMTGRCRGRKPVLPKGRRDVRNLSDAHTSTKYVPVAVVDELNNAFLFPPLQLSKLCMTSLFSSFPKTLSSITPQPSTCREFL